MNDRPYIAFIVLLLLLNGILSVATGQEFSSAEVLSAKWIIYGQVTSRETKGSGFTGGEERLNITILEVFKGDSLPSETIIVRRKLTCMSILNFFPGSQGIFYLRECKDGVYNISKVNEVIAGIMIVGEDKWAYKEVCDYVGRHFWAQDMKSTMIFKNFELLIAARVDVVHCHSDDPAPTPPPGVKRDPKFLSLDVSLIDFYGGYPVKRKLSVYIFPDSACGFTQEYIRNLQILPGDVFVMHCLRDSEKIRLRSPEALFRLEPWLITDDSHQLKSMYRYRKFVKSILEFDQSKDEMIREADAILLGKYLGDRHHFNFEIYHIFKGDPSLPSVRIELPRESVVANDTLFQQLQFFAENEPKILFLKNYYKNSVYQLLNGSPSVQSTTLGRIAFSIKRRDLLMYVPMSFEQFQEYVDRVSSH